ncbi:protein of unknown function, partial [Pseudomonas inefficax]
MLKVSVLIVEKSYKKREDIALAKRQCLFCELAYAQAECDLFTRWVEAGLLASAWPTRVGR